MYCRIAHSLFGFFCYLITKTVNNLTIENLESVKKVNGPKIYVIPHPSTFDPFYFYSHLNKPTILMTQFVFNLPVIGWIVRNCGFIPVPLKRTGESGKAAFESARWALLDNHSILIAPEGQLTNKNSFDNAKTGAARLAIELDVPIIPIGLKHKGKMIEKELIDTQKNVDVMKICWGGSYQVKFGQPIYLERDANPKEATKLIMNEIRKLMV
jgi:1-acyl-sn-glycerol-3-phosphate acyltransferase